MYTSAHTLRKSLHNKDKDFETINGTRFFAELCTKKGEIMEQFIEVTCPLDRLPCEKGCPDRYIDTPDGGCFLTTAAEMGANIIHVSDDCTAVMFSPGG